MRQARLGEGAYAIYLFNLTAIGVIYKAIKTVGLLRLLPVSLSYPLVCAGAIVAGLLISRWIEFPLLRRLRSQTPAPADSLPARAPA